MNESSLTNSQSFWATGSKTGYMPILLVATAYFFTAHFGLQLQFESTHASPVWPASGLAIALILLLGYKAGYGIFLGACMANLMDFYSTATSLPFRLSGLFSYILHNPLALFTSISIGIGNTLEALVFYRLLDSKHTRSNPFDSVRNVSLFLGSALLACGISATIGVSILVLSNYLPETLFTTTWFTWWTGDITGVLIVTPCILLLSNKSIYQQFFITPVSHLFLIGLLLLISGFTFFEWFSIEIFTLQAYLFIPVLLWINFQFGRTASLAILFISAFAVIGTLNGSGPFYRQDQNISLILLQGFIAILALTVLIQDAINQEKNSALDKLERTNNQLAKKTELYLQAKEEAESKAIQAEQASKLKSEFLATMSHEIRTPMNGVIGMIDLILNSELHEEQANRLHIVKLSADSLLTIINDILDYSKVEAGKLKLENTNFQLESMINQCVYSFEPISKGNNIILKYVHDPRLPAHVLGDCGKLRQIINNLLSNAIKFTEKGEVLVESKLIEKKHHRIYAKISVKDSGIGISSSNLETIFESFHQVENSHTKPSSGTGLGLAIVKKLVSLMGGTISVKSSPGTGSVFAFTVVLEEPTLSPEIKTNTLSGEYDFARSKNLDILLVEDNLTNQKVAFEMLIVLGFKVDLANDGEEALTAFNSKSYDIILMDCHMPKIDGFETTQQIREIELANNANPAIIIALTANAMAGDRDKCIQAGMDDYLAKPLTLRALDDKLQSWVT